MASVPSGRPSQEDLERVQLAADMFAKQLREAGFDIEIPIIRSRATSIAPAPDDILEGRSAPQTADTHDAATPEYFDESLNGKRKNSWLAEGDKKDANSEEHDSAEVVEEEMEEAEDEWGEDDESSLRGTSQANSESVKAKVPRSAVKFAAWAGAMAVEGEAATQTIFKRTIVQLPATLLPLSPPRSPPPPPPIPSSLPHARRSSSNQQRHLPAVERPDYAYEGDNLSLGGPSTKLTRKRQTETENTSQGRRNEDARREKSRHHDRKHRAKSPSLADVAEAVAANREYSPAGTKIIEAGHPEDSSVSPPSDSFPPAPAEAGVRKKGKKSGKHKFTGRRSNKSHDPPGAVEKDKKNTIQRLFGRVRQRDDDGATAKPEAPAKEVLPEKKRPSGLLETKMEQHLRHQRENIDASEKRKAKSSSLLATAAPSRARVRPLNQKSKAVTMLPQIPEQQRLASPPL
jgi:hypothetical protein